jgi:hypothetical protein
VCVSDGVLVTVVVVAGWRGWLAGSTMSSLPFYLTVQSFLSHSVM